MKRLLTALILAVTMTATPALASTFGPAQPTAEPGRLAIGGGVFHFTGNLEFDDSIFPDEEADQTRFFVQGAYGIADGYEIYARLGGSDLEYEDGFLGSENLDADSSPFGSIGLKGAIHSTPEFSVGFFAEGTVYGGYEEDMDFGATNVEVEIDPSWEANIGLAFQREIEGAYLYGGPVIYYREGDAKVTITNPDFESSDSYNEENFAGAFIGVRWALKNGLKIDVESQFKSETSFGAVVSYSFR